MEAGPTFKFSNILEALVSSYVLANGEGWTDVMASYVIIFIYLFLTFRINTTNSMVYFSSHFGSLYQLFL